MSDKIEKYCCRCTMASSGDFVEINDELIGPLCPQCYKDICDFIGSRVDKFNRNYIEGLELRVASLIEERNRYDAVRRVALEKVEFWRTLYHEAKSRIAEFESKLDM